MGIVMVHVQSGKEFPDMRQNDRRKSLLEWEMLLKQWAGSRES